MKITGVRTQTYELDMTRPIGDANGPEGTQHIVSMIVYLDTDEGLTGLSLSGPAVRRQIQSMVDELLVGRDPRGVRGLWKRMVDSVFKGGNRGVACAALSALDIALWDLKAKANNEPLWKTLGASSRCVKGYASGIDMPLSDDQLRAFYERMAGMGMSAGKLKVGLDVEHDLVRIGIMQQALAKSGKTPSLMVDVNEYWSPKQSIRHIRFFEEHYDLTWVEEPARRWDYRGLRKVSESIRAAVATGENLNEMADYVPLISNGAVDILNLGHGASGFTGMLQIADLAYAYEIPVSVMNCPANFAAHVAAALPNHIMMEVLEAGRHALMRVDNHIEDGWIVLGDKPGLGIEFDEEKLAAATVDKPRPGSRPLAWGRRRDAGLYPVAPGESQEVGEE